MPNPQILRGFMPYPRTLRQNEYPYQTGTGTELRNYDLCRLRTQGNVGWLSAAGGSLIGCALGASYRRDGRAYILVADHPNQTFLAWDAGLTTAASVIHMGNQLNPTNRAGNGTTKISTMRLDFGTVGVLTAALRLIKKADLTNEVTTFGSFTPWLCQITAHQLAATGQGT